MRNLQDYINKYNEIVANLGYQGQGIDVLVQLLANASYIGEVENATYMQEASLEKSSLVNSKIQHCVDMMYSVFRGSCPRVLIKIKPSQYLNLLPNQEKPLIESQTFKVYYSGYYSITTESGEEIKKGPDLVKGGQGSIHRAPITLAPSVDDSETYIIECLLSLVPPTTMSTKISDLNSYYVQSLEDNLSNDMCVKIDGQVVPVTRIFTEHITYPDHVFDLTIPGFGSRVYVANYLNNSRLRSDEVGMTINTQVDVLWYKYSELSQYNQSELQRIKVPGSELVAFNEEFLKNYNNENNTLGLVFLPESGRADTRTIHYKANRDRYVNSIIRSNSDVGTVLEENFPSKIVTGGTNYLFQTTKNDSGSSLTIYYIPSGGQKLLEPEIADFIKKCSAYYIITDGISVVPGTKYLAKFDISLELYNNSDTDWRSEIGDGILKQNYSKKFGVVFNQGAIESIKTLISKYSNVKKISGISVSYFDEKGNRLESSNPINPETSYFDISVSIVTKAN